MKGLSGLSGLSAMCGGGPRFYADDFNDNSLDPALWGQLDPSTPALEQNQRLELPPTGGVAGVLLQTPLDCRGHIAQVRAKQRSGDVSLLWSAISLGSQYDILITSRAAQGVYWAFIYGPNGFVYSSAQSASAFDNDLMRLRHDVPTNTVYFEASSDNGATWQFIGSFALSTAGLDVAQCYVKLRHLGAGGVTALDDFSSDILR